MNPDIFISYRRDDALQEAGRLADTIRHQFGPDSVFIDTSDIRIGQEWPEALSTAAESAAVMLVVIGSEWILARDEWGRRRLDEPDDWVRREIEIGLTQDKTVMPLLVRHALMPPHHALPAVLAPLSSKQAFEVRGERWTHDVDFVLRQVTPFVGRQRDEPAESAPDETAPSFTQDDFRAISLGFDSRDGKRRIATAKRVKELAAYLELAHVLAFCASRKSAERVGAVIALGVHLRSSKEVRTNRSVLAALGQLLTDGSSLVRYRAAEVLRSSPSLVPNYDDVLALMAKADQNREVRDMAAKALRQARR